MERSNEKGKLIFNMGVARALLRAGCTVIDCKQDRMNADKTVLVFRDDAHFQEVFAKINDELKVAKTQTVVE